jgi:hypothetical protein
MTGLQTGPAEGTVTVRPNPNTVSIPEQWPVAEKATFPVQLLVLVAIGGKIYPLAQRELASAPGTGNYTWKGRCTPGIS